MQTLAIFCCNLVNSPLSADRVLIVKGCVESAPSAPAWFPLLLHSWEISVTCSSPFLPPQLPPASSQKAPGTGSSQVHMNQVPGTSTGQKGPSLENYPGRHMSPTGYFSTQLSQPELQEFTPLGNLDLSHSALWLHTLWMTKFPPPWVHQDPPPPFSVSGRSCSSTGFSWNKGFSFISWIIWCRF